MPLFRRLACRFWHLAHVRAAPARSAELWCRPATVLVLRDPRRARAPVAGWR
jgi:hypothetical protein